MNSRRNLKDDALFLGALAAVLVGIGLLFETTGVLRSAQWAGPLLVLAVGGILFYLALVQGRSGVFFGAGMFFILSSPVLLLAASGAGIAKTWPLLMVAAGVGWSAYGFWRWKRPRVNFLVPSAIIVTLGLFFALFSFGIIKTRLSTFISDWWPLVFILGGVALFVAWSFRARRAKGRRRIAHP